MVAIQKGIGSFVKADQVMANKQVFRSDGNNSVDLLIYRAARIQQKRRETKSIRK